MIYFSALKTSERISLSFSLLGFISLLLFLALVNVTYFFIWYAEQKEISFTSMEENYYSTIQRQEQITDIDWFKQYLLTKDTIIISNNGILERSQWVASNLSESIDSVRKTYFYKDWDTFYFIYSKYFDGIWEVKVFFDTTTYISSQIIIIKIGLIFIFIVFILQYLMGRYISTRLLRDLRNIANKVKHVDINSDNKHIICECMPEDDEIRILSQALNDSYDTIDSQTSKLKQFLTDVSHEFKTPLMVVNSKIDVLEKKKKKNRLNEADIEEFFAFGRQSVNKLNGLLQSLFFVSKIEEQSSCLVKTKLTVQPFIEKKINNLAEWFAHKKLSYDLQISPDLEYHVEENTFSILMDNLLTNAMKFSPESMHIEVYADQESFYVRDNGPGIWRTDREKIWEKFYRKDTNKEWFGVWLYLVKRIVDIYDWKIKIEQDEWKWAKFKVEIS